MALYDEQIEKLKQKSNSDVIKDKYDDKAISIKIVDNSDETINLLLDWRQKNWNWFDTKFQGNYDRTKNWVEEQILSNPKRILFLIIFDGKKVGHIGLDLHDQENNSIYITDVLRGVKGFAPGLMEYTIKLYIRWIFDYFKNSTIKLRVFSDAYKAINCYERCGLLTVDSVPLKREITEDGWKWVEKKIKSDDEYGERYFNVMEIKNSLSY